MRNKGVISIVLFVMLVALHTSISVLYYPMQLLFYGCALFLILYQIIRPHKYTLSFKVKWRVLFFALFQIAILAVNGNRYGHKEVYSSIITWSLLLVIPSYFKQYRSLRRALLWGLICCIYLEIAISLLQQMEIIVIGNDNYSYGGSLGNPSALAGFLSAIMPILLSLLPQYKRMNNGTVYSIIASGLLLGVFYIIISISRGAWIALLVSALYVLNHHYSLYHKVARFVSLNKHRMLVLILASSFLLSLFVGLYYIKSDSAYGRLFVYKTTIMTPQENVIIGDGIGSFEANYGKWQMHYFAERGGNARERWVADYVTCAYNDYLQTYVDLGVVGLVCLLLIVLSPFCKRKQHRSNLVVGAEASVIAIGILAMVSYPMELSQILFQLILSLSIIFSEQCYLNRKISIVNQVVLPVYATIISCLLGRGFYGEFLTNYGQTLVLGGNTPKGIELYKKVYPIMKNNGKFLFNIGVAYTFTGDLILANRCFEEANLKSSDISILLLMGNNHLALENYDEAESAYTSACNEIPSRLYPKYLLLKLFLKTSRKDDALSVAKTILYSKEKVSNTASREIKTDTKRVIDSLLSNKPVLPEY